MAAITSSAFGNDTGTATTSVSTGSGTGTVQNLSAVAGQPIIGAYECVNGGTVTGVTDTIGNTYTVLTPETTFGPTVVVFYCASSNGTNASNVITATVSAATGFKAIAAVTGTGFDTASLFITQQNGAAGAATSISPTNPLACGTSDAMLLFGAIASNDREFDAVSGGTEVYDAFTAAFGSRGGSTQYKFTTGGGNQTVSAAVTGGVASNLQIAVAAFKTLPPGPAIDAQPTDQSASLGGTATFTISSSTATSYQWQDNRSGTFANVPDGTGATTSSYTTAATAAGFQGRQYRCIASTVGGSTTSSSARLTISDLPVYLWSTAVQSGNDVWLRDPSTFSAGGGSTPVPLSDSAAGTETASIAVTASASDSSAGADSGAIAATVAPTDSSAGTDAAAIAAAAGLSDSAAGTESASLANAIAATDSAAGTDATTIAVTLTASDSAAGTDSVSVDTGGTPVALNDSASGTESASLAAAINGPDSGAGTESASIAATATASDASAGSDTLAAAIAVAPTDSSAGADAAAVAAAAGISDASAGTESAAADVAIQASDAAAATDGIAVDTGNPDKTFDLTESAIGSDNISVQTFGLVLGGRVNRRIPKALRDSGFGLDSISIERIQKPVARRTVDVVLIPQRDLFSDPEPVSFADQAGGDSRIYVERWVREAPRLIRSQKPALRRSATK